MPAHKNQHYTPRCLLKPFTLNGGGKAINLYTLRKDKLVSDAPVKNQCSRNYFYGDDLVLENTLAEIEGPYSKMLGRVIAQTETQEDMSNLLFFMHLQLRRTDMAIRRFSAMQQGLFREVFGDDEPENAPESFNIQSSLQSCVELHETLTDLKPRIVVNRTALPFVICDDPAVLANRFANQRLKQRDYGLHSSGLMLTMPLTRHLAVLAYDGNVYTAPNLADSRIVLKKDSDVEAFNELQFLKASASIFFDDWSDREYVREQFERSKERRLGDLGQEVTFTWARLEEEREDGTRLFSAVPKEEAQGERTLIHQSVKYPMPAKWISELAYRNLPKTFHNGTGAGHVRRREWLSRD